MIEFDDFLDQYIKAGPHQITTFVIVSIITFVQAMENNFLGIFLSILASQWTLTIRQIIGLGTAYHVGMLMGNTFCALFADKMGRKNLLVTGTLFTFSTFVFNCQVQFYWHVFALRLAYGLVMGSILNLPSILLSETVTKNFRGRVQVCLETVYIAGEMYLILTCLIFLDDLQGGNWRGLILFNSIPALLCFILSYMFLRESARFLISKGRFVEGFQELILMGKNNQGQDFEITSQQKDSLITWQIGRFYIGNQSVSLRALFNGPNRNLTLKVFTIFIVNNLSSAIIYLMLPLWLQDRKLYGFVYIFYTYLAELIAIAILYFIIDKKKIVGRLRIIKLCLICMALSTSMIYLYPHKLLVVGICFYRFFNTLLYPPFIAFINENYSTIYRSMGLGIASAAGMIASSLSPMIAFYLYSIDPYYPLIAMFIFLLTASAIALTFKIDRTEEKLDLETLENIDHEQY